jgi:hypothetical protein
LRVSADSATPNQCAGYFAGRCGSPRASIGSAFVRWNEDYVDLRSDVALAGGEDMADGVPPCRHQYSLSLISALMSRDGNKQLQTRHPGGEKLNPPLYAASGTADGDIHCC